MAGTLIRGVVLFLVCGCGFSGHAKGDDAPVDAPKPIDDTVQIDTAIDVLVDGWTWQPTNFDPSTVPAGAPALNLAPGDYDYVTNTNTMTPSVGTLPSAVLPGTPQVRIVFVSSLSIPSGARLHVRGDYPLLIVVDGDAMIAGDIDAATDDASACTPGNGANGAVGTMVAFGGGGGGGGGFGAPGGSGGGGGGSTAMPGPTTNGGIAGAASGAMTLSPLRGGCPGGAGSEWTVGLANGGAGGAGGGALQITAHHGLVTSGRLFAGGKPGILGVQSNAGGGGGGSGGAIFLEASTIAITGELCANGGGGGEGSSMSVPGGSGEVGTCSTSLAAGGMIASYGGDGGQGSSVASPSGGPGSVGVEGGGPGGGGGGGGGGVGRIRVRSVEQAASTSGAVITPAPFLQ